MSLPSFTAMEEHADNATSSSQLPDPNPQFALETLPHLSTPSAASGIKSKRRRRTRYHCPLATFLLVKPYLTTSSPQDHAILEAAYLKNSKPDKTERAYIVSQVGLGEKEVQVRNDSPVLHASKG